MQQRSNKLMPELMLVGAPKCGTTTLYDTLIEQTEFSGGKKKVFLIEDLIERPLWLLNQVRTMFGFEILDQLHGFSKKNVSFKPRKDVTANAVRSIRRMASIGKRFIPSSIRMKLLRAATKLEQEPIPKLDPKFRNELTQGCLRSIEATEELIDRDLSHWKDGSGS